MVTVDGIGGVFFRAKDPQALADWYAAHLGVSVAPTDATTPPWRTSAGVVVFAPFAANTDYFPADQQFMLNFRVSDLDGLLAQLRAAAIPIRNETEMEGIGRFAHISDPEGNAVELWEPALGAS